MTELCAVCPACRKPLDGDLVASRCNHVFHRACLSEALEQCPKCKTPDVWKEPLDLYGVGFGEDRDPCRASVALALAGAADGGEPGLGGVIAEISSLREDLRDQRRKLGAMQSQAAEARGSAEKQQEKLRAAEKAAAKRAAERAQLAAAIAKFQEDHESLCAQMDQIRQRDTVLEYAEVLRKRSDAEALAFLTKMVSMVSEPWKILVEVARLRDDSRGRLAQWQKESAAAVRRERELRALLTETERRVLELQKACGARKRGRARAAPY